MKLSGWRYSDIYGFNATWQEVDVDLVEIPPHYRTIKILTQSSFYDYISMEYVSIPYTQFYFVVNKTISRKLSYAWNYVLGRIKSPKILISNSLKSINEGGLPQRTIFSVNAPQDEICWGNTPFNGMLTMSRSEIISKFWLSTFSSVSTNLTEATSFRIIE